eukprot:6399988-Pyramimonas_sp.AAC.2
MTTVGKNKWQSDSAHLFPGAAVIRARACQHEIEACEHVRVTVGVPATIMSVSTCWAPSAVSTVLVLQLQTYLYYKMAARTRRFMYSAQGCLLAHV